MWEAITLHVSQVIYRRLMIRVGQRRHGTWEADVHSAISVPGHSLELDVVHIASVLTTDIPQFPQSLLFCDHKAELLAGDKLLSTEGTRCIFFAAVAATQATVPLKEVLP